LIIPGEWGDRCNRVVSRLLRSSHPVDSGPALAKESPRRAAWGAVYRRGLVVHVLFVSPSSVGMTAPVQSGLTHDRQLRVAARADMPRRAGSSKKKPALLGLTRARDSLWLTIPVRLLG
jgi:hypothetical protein